MLFEEGVQKGFYAKVSRLGEHWFELDLHFLSLGGGEIALGWWFEECLVPYLNNTEKLKNVKSISIVTGYGKTRTRGRRFGDDGMRKRCKAMLQFMNIQELPQPNAGRIHVDKESLITEVTKNGGKVIFDLEGYIRWKENETSINSVPDTPQMIRARFKPQVLGSGRPPFTRIENEHTSPEYRLENQKKRGFYVDDKPVASVFEEIDEATGQEDAGYEEPRSTFRGGRGGRDGDDYRRGGFRGGGGGRGFDDKRDFRDGDRGFSGSERGFGEGRSFHNREHRDSDRGGRFHGDGRRNNNDEGGFDRGFDDRRGGGFGRGARRGDSNYGSHEGKYDAGQGRRGGFDEAQRDRIDDRGSRQPRRFNNERQDDNFNDSGERRSTYGNGNNQHEGDLADSREYGRSVDEPHNDEYRSQRPSEDDYSAPKHSRQNAYQSDNQFGNGGPNRGSFRARDDQDIRKRGYDESDRRTVSSRGYTLEPQSQKRRLS